MDILTTRIIRDSADLEVSVAGFSDGDKSAYTLLKPSDFKDCAALRLNAVFHSVESGLKLRLYWEGEDAHTLLLPIEGRGIMDLTRFGGLEDPRKPNWTGNIILVAEGLGHFVLSLEFSKQRT